jgi:DNA polymerase III subunit delta'
VSAPFPWLEPAWQRLLETKSWPAQALLIAGPRGVGKAALAQAWAGALLCEQPASNGEACGQCAACHWFAAGTHPDHRVISLREKESKEGETRMATAIEVEQAREAVDFVQMSTHRAGRRVVVVDPADSLNLAAANALLKVLEEPPLNTSFLLVSDQPRRLLPTIRSRCTRIDVGLPPLNQALAWLQENQVDEAGQRLALAGGSPLIARDYAESDELEQRRTILEELCKPQQLDPVGLGEKWKAVKPQTWHELAYKWLEDLLAERLNAGTRFNPDFAAVLNKLGRQANLVELLELAKVHAELGRTVMHPLNRPLQLQAWLIRYRHVFDETI